MALRRGGPHSTRRGGRDMLRSPAASIRLRPAIHPETFTMNETYHLISSVT